MGNNMLIGYITKPTFILDAFSDSRVILFPRSLANMYWSRSLNDREKRGLLLLSRDDRDETRLDPTNHR